MPDIDISPITTSLTHDSFYKIDNFNIADVLCKNTIDGYINIGDFFCISSNHDDIQQVKFSIAHKTMSLFIEKDLYYSLGAVNLCKYQKEVKDDIHHFEIDLSSNQNMDKLRSELRSELINKISIQFAWHSSQVCTSSIAKYFTDMGYSVSSHRNKHKLESLYGLKIPTIPQTNVADDDGEEVNNFLELIGMNMLGCDVEDNQCSSYELPSDNLIDAGRGKVLHFKGFITQLQLDNLIRKCQELLQDSSFPYIAISVNCYANYCKIIIVTASNFYYSTF